MFRTLRRASAGTGAALLFVLAGCGRAAEADPADWQTLSASRQHAQETALAVDVEYGAGRLVVQPADAGLLYHTEIRYREDLFTPIHEYDPAAQRLRIGQRSAGERVVMRSPEEAGATLQVNPGVPVALNLQFGAGEAILELGGMTLRDLNLGTGASATRLSFDAPNRMAAERIRIQAGAASVRAEGLGNARADRFEVEGGVGRTILDFSGAWDRSATGSIQMGMGALTLRFPRALGVRIDREGTLTRFRAGEMVRQGDSYYSPNWEEATHRLTLTISAALGSIDVELID